MAEPKDYSKSAVNLCQPQQVKELLHKLQDLKGDQSDYEAELQQMDAYNGLQQTLAGIADIEKQIKVAITKHGSFQDIEAGAYGVKYARVTKTYHPEPFKEQFPQYAPAIIVEAVDAEALNGLIKGKLLTEEQLLKAGIISTGETYAYYIR